MRRTLLAIALLFFGSTTLVRAADGELRVIELKHRTAQEMIPLIEPLLAPGDAVTGMDYRLIVRTSEKNLGEIARLLAKLDVARRNLTITVRQGVASDESQTMHEIAGEKRFGNARVILRKSSAPDGSGLTVGGSRPDSLHYRTQRTDTSARGAHTQVLHVQDGQRAYIRIGQSVPHVRKILALSRDRTILTEGVEFQNVITGFELLPRVIGDSVRLEITPRLSTLENPGTGLVSFQELSTTVTVKLGEWIDLGRLGGAGEQIRHEILDSARVRASERRTVFVKVE